MSDSAVAPLTWCRTVDAISCSSKCGRVRLIRVGAHHRNNWAIHIDGLSRGTALHGIREAKRMAQKMVSKDGE